MICAVVVVVPLVVLSSRDCIIVVFSLKFISFTMSFFGLGFFKILCKITIILTLTLKASEVKYFPSESFDLFCPTKFSELPTALYEVYLPKIVQFFENSTKFKTWKANYINFSPYALSRRPASWLMLQTTLKIRQHHFDPPNLF